MKNTILKVGLFNLGLSVLGLNSTLTQAGVVDFSKCGVNSSFAVVTQSEGPTYACGGIDNGVGNPINVLNGNKFEAVEDFKELPAFKGLSFSRFYNSQSHADTALGYGWYSSFDIKLYEQPDIIQIRLESGQRINFKKNRISLGNNQFVIRALPLNPSDGWIEKKIDGSGWVWHKTQSNQDYLFQYLGGKDPSLAHITKISALSTLDKNNPALNFSFIYDLQQRLAVVKNGQGQQLSFAYSTTQFGLPQITLTTPLGKYYYFLDRHHNLAQVVYPDGRRLKYSYDPKFQGGDIHNLTAKWVFDPDQKKFRLISQWQYDQQDRAILSQHANGVEKVTIQFDPRTTKAMPANYSANKPVFKNVVTNSLGQKTTYSYQVVGTQFQLSESFGAGCASCGEVNKRYRFNPQGLVAYAADLNSSGQVIRAIDLKYNDLGEVIARTVSGVGIQSQTTNYEYESYQVQQGNMADDLANTSSPLLTQLNQQNYRRLKAESRNSVVVGKQYRKQYQYNSNNQLISVKETGFSPLGDTLVRETRYGYDPQGRLSWEDGPLPNGPSNSPKDSDITQYVYNSKNPVLIDHIVYPQGLSAHFKYDQQGRLIKYIGVDHLQAELSYNAQGEVNQFKYAGVSTQLDYTNNGKLKAILSQTGQRMNFNYDETGQLLSLYDGQNNQIKLIKNSENQVSQAQLLNPDGTIAQERKYDLNDHQANDPVLSALKNTPTTLNDSVSNIARPDLQGLSAFRLYNLMQTPMHLDWSAPVQAKNTDQDSQNRLTYYFYNDFGEIVKVQSPVTGITTYQYNPSGLIIGQQRQDGSRSIYVRDTAQRVVEIKSLNAQKQLDEQGKIVWGKYNKPSRIQFKAGEERFFYNENAQLLKHELIVDGQHFNVGYEFNNHAQLIGRTLPNGQHLEYRYRTENEARAGLLESIQLKRGPLGFVSQSVIENLNSATDTSVNYGYLYGNGLKHHEVLDKQGRIVSSGNVYTGETSLDYLNQESSPNKVKYRYKTEVGSQAPQQFSPGFSERLLQLDLFRKQSETQLLPVTASSAQNFNHSFKVTAQYGSEYDQLGRKRWAIEDDKVLFFSYDSVDRLVKVEYLKPNEHPKTVSDYVTKDAQLNKQTLAEYKYNLFGQRIQKTVASTTGKGTKTTYYFYDGSQLLAEADDQGNIDKSYIWMNQTPVGMIANDELYYIHVDHRQAPISLTNAQRKVVWQAELSDNLFASPLAYNHGRFGFIDFNLRGSNQYFDVETNLHYNTNRYFDAKNEKYITPDPLGLAVGPDLYAFALGQPHTVSDPLGLAPVNYGEQTFAWKLEFVLVYAVKAPGVVGIGTELQNTLQEMINDLPTVVATFVAWQVITAIPFVGAITNALMVAYAAYSMGKEAINMAIGLGKWVAQVSRAKTRGELECASKELGRLLTQVFGNVIGGISPAKRLKLMIASGKNVSKTVAPKQDSKTSGSSKSKLKLDFKSFSPKCFSPYGSGYKKLTSSKDKQDYVTEYNRQLSRQQQALNNMSAAEYKAARDAYKKNGRAPDSAKEQADYRRQYQSDMEKDLEKEYSKTMSDKEAKAAAKAGAEDAMKNLAALHEPDMFAGGYFDCKPTCMGDASVNSSIGAQWKKIIADMDKYADDAIKAGTGNAKLNLQLDVCKP